MQYNIPNEEDDDSYDKFMIYKRDFEQYLKTIIPSNYEIRDSRLQNTMVVFDIKFINKSFESFNDFTSSVFICLIYFFKQRVYETKIFSRLVDLCGGKITPLQINKLTNEEIKSIGTANSKVSYIRNITNAVLNGELNFESLKK